MTPQIIMQMGMYKDGRPMWLRNIFLSQTSQGLANAHVTPLRWNLHQDITDVEDGEKCVELLADKMQVLGKPLQSC